MRSVTRLRAAHRFERLGSVITDRTRYPDPGTGVDVWIPQ